LALFEGCRILVTPGMIELGAEQDARNAEFGAQAAAVCTMIALVGEKQTAAIRQGALAAGFPADKILVAETLTELMPLVYAWPCKERKIILLENDLPDNFNQ